MFRSLLSAYLHPVQITALDPAQPDGLVLGQPLCWAAQLVEGQEVELIKQTTGERVRTSVRFGAPGQAQVNGPAAEFFWVEETIVVAAYVPVAESNLAEHAALFVTLEANNRPIEIRREKVRRPEYAWSLPAARGVPPPSAVSKIPD